MNLVHSVALLAVAQFFTFGVLVGRARAKYGVKPPAISGHQGFERALRVQLNTLEQLAGFLPCLLIASVYWSSVIVASIGVVYLIGRLVYRRAYLADPSTRQIGFLLTVIPTVVLFALGLAGAVFRS